MATCRSTEPKDPTPRIHNVFHRPTCSLTFSLAGPVSRWGAAGGLVELAENKGRLYFGTQISSYYFVNGQFSNIANTQFNQYTPENETKWEVIEPERGVFSWTGSDLVSGPIIMLSSGLDVDIKHILDQAKEGGYIFEGITSCGTNKRE